MTYAVAIREYNEVMATLLKEIVHTMRMRCDMDGDYGDVNDAKVGRPIDLHNQDQYSVREWFSFPISIHEP